MEKPIFDIAESDKIVPAKTAEEQKLFEKYQKWLYKDFIPPCIVRQYKQDLEFLNPSEKCKK